MSHEAIERVLVLGGGGVIGVAWESGLMVGMHEAGFDPRSLDAFIGTSAGAFVGTRLAAGRLPKLEKNRTEAMRDRGPVDTSALDLEALKQIFTLWGAMRQSTTEQRIAIGRLAAPLYRKGERALIERIGGETPVADWPDKPLVITAVDTETGVRRAFDRSSGVELPRAIAASAAVPGLFPSITIDGRLYTDGQVHSSTNADLALAFEPAQVLIAMPTNQFTGHHLGPHAESMLELELAKLKAAGCAVSLKGPSAEDAVAFGRNMMDGQKAGIAYAIGLEAGRAWAAELR